MFFAHVWPQHRLGAVGLAWFKVSLCTGALVGAVGCASAPPAITVERPPEALQPPPEHPAGIWSQRYVSPSAYAHYIEARIHWEQGRLDKAVAHVDLALAFDPESVYLHAVLAELHAELGEMEEAAEHLDAARKADPESPWVALAAARLALVEGQWDEAIKAASTAARWAQTHTPATVVMSRALRSAGQAVDAVAVMTPLHQSQPHDSQVALEFGAVLEAAGRTRQAQDVRLECARHAPAGDVQCWSALAISAASGAAPEAPVLLWEAAAATSSSRAAVAALSEALFERQLASGLQTYIEACVAQRPSHAERFALLGRLHRQERRLAQAAAAFGRVPPDASVYVDSQRQQIELLLELGRPKDALNMATKALQSAPNAPWMHVSMSRVQHRLGRTRAAERTLEKAARAFPGAGVVRLGQAELWLDQGKARKAQTALEDAHALGEQGPYQQRLLARCWVEQGQRWEEAEALLRRLRTQSKRPDPDALLLLGQVLLHRESYEDALVCLEEAAKARPKDPQILAALGEARLADGQMDAALASWQAALALTQDKALRRRLQRNIQTLTRP